MILSTPLLCWVLPPSTPTANFLFLHSPPSFCVWTTVAGSLPSPVTSPPFEPFRFLPDAAVVFFFFSDFCSRRRFSFRRLEIAFLLYWIPMAVFLVTDALADFTKRIGFFLLFPVHIRICGGSHQKAFPFSVSLRPPCRSFGFSDLFFVAGPGYEVLHGFWEFPFQKAAFLPPSILCVAVELRVRHLFFPCAPSV